MKRIDKRKTSHRETREKFLSSEISRLTREEQYLDLSLADLESEHISGDLPEEDYLLLKADYLRRMNGLRFERQSVEALLSDINSREVQTQLFAAKEADKRLSATDKIKNFLGQRRTKKYLFGLLIVSLIAAVSTAAYSLAGNRLPGQFATGSVSLTKQALIRQQLLQAQVLGSEGNLQSAVQLYGEVLLESKDNPTALSYQGWLIRLIGKTSGSKKLLLDGDKKIAFAAQRFPGYANVHAFYAIALLQDFSDEKSAVAQLNDFLSDNPSKQFLSVLGGQIADTYRELHLPIPKQLSGYKT